jgi:hypothetical protein
VGPTEAPLHRDELLGFHITDLNWDMLEPHVGSKEAPLLPNTRLTLLTLIGTC